MVSRSHYPSTSSSSSASATATTTAGASDARINIGSSSELYSQFDDLQHDLHSTETEHTWQKIERALLRVQAITRGGATKFPEFVGLLKENSEPINNSLLSERTKLSGTAGDLLNSIAPRLAERFEPLVSVFVPTLLLICARTNKVAVKRAEKSLHFIVKHCKPPSVVSYLKEAVKDKGQGLRAVAAATLVLVLEYTEKERLTRRVADIEACIKSGATDSNPKVRQTTKRLFELYVSIWPERVEHFTKPMTPTIRRYLSLPKTGALHVEIPPITTASAPQPSASRASSHTNFSSSSHPSRHEDAFPPPQSSSHVSAARSAPSYNFFPDLKNSTSSSAASSSAARMPAAPGFSVNDATYVKRGLFAEQIAAARNARLARVPSFNFDDVPKSSSESAQATLSRMQRQPSFEHLRSHGTATAPAPTFRVPRFDVVPTRQDSDSNRPRSGHGQESASHMHGSINANAPSFAAVSGPHGKSALLAAYKQAFVGDVNGAKPSSSRENRYRDRSEKSSKHSSDKRREKTVTVRFEPESEGKESEGRHVPAASDEIRRSKSAPQIVVKTDAPNEASEPQIRTPTEAEREQRSASKEAIAAVHSEDDEDQRPSTPPERILHAQTPKTGVKASRVPAQRVAMPSAVKVSAMRVAMPTPSAKVAASRVINTSESVESSPAAKARADFRPPPAQPAQSEAADTSAERAQDGDEEPKKEEEKDKVKTEENVQDQPPVVKKSAVSAEQPTKVAAKPAPSAALAAKARLAAAAAKNATTSATVAAKKVVPKVSTTVSKPAVVKRTLASSTTATKPVAKLAASSTASSIKSSKPSSTARPGGVTSAATKQAKPLVSKPIVSKPVVTSKPATVAPSTTLAAKKADSAPLVRTSRLTASTASTRNKIVPAASVKKFQPAKPSSLSSSSVAAKTRPKSSIAASLTAKSKLVGAQSAASDKANAVRKASVTMAARIDKHRRASAAAAAAPLPKAALVVPAEPVVATVAEDQVGKGAAAQESASTSEVAALALIERHEEETVNESREVDIVDAEKEAADFETEAVEAAGDPVQELDEAVEELIQPNESAAEEKDPARISEEASAVEGDAVVEEMSATTEQEAVKEEEEEEEKEKEQDGQSHVESVEPALAVATPIKVPVLAENGTPFRVRTPLGTKDTNLPKVTSAGNVMSQKNASPISSGHTRSEARSTPAPSPLRRSTTPRSVLRLAKFEPESSFEESESESEDETDEVVQLHFRPRTIPPATHKIVVANKQLVLGADSSDDASVVEANGDDETVLLESQLA